MIKKTQSAKQGSRSKTSAQLSKESALNKLEKKDQLVATIAQTEKVTILSEAKSTRVSTSKVGAKKMARKKSTPSSKSEAIGQIATSETTHATTEIETDNLPAVDQTVQQNLAQNSPHAADSPLRIFQIFYAEWQRELLDPHFSPISYANGDTQFLDFALLDKLSKSEYVEGAQLWGALSWRFTETTGLSGSDLINYIKSHAGADVYFCHPFPENEALFHNVWLQGEVAYPQFLALSQAVFQVTGLPENELTAVSGSEHYSAANFFVASPKFWKLYIPWVMSIVTMANKKLPHQVRDILHSAQTDERGIYQGASYVPFIVERLFPIFMKTVGQHLKAHKIPLPEKERELNVHLKLLREMKDTAVRTKSAWMAACWVNYRNIYLTQVNGKEWSTKYLRASTPTEIKFT